MYCLLSHCISPKSYTYTSLYLFCKKTRDVSKSFKIRKLNLTVTTNGQNDKDRLTNNQIQAADTRMEHQRAMASWIKDGLSWATTCLLEHDWRWQVIRNWSDALVSHTVKSQQLVPSAWEGVSVVQGKRVSNEDPRSIMINREKMTTSPPYSSNRLL